ncbi:lasso peptide biosynthesis B2 protein [uncultured Caulobacter sp.]|uniref:lasso peptide biosynthesis B2 protein n=1 Tax=uncultured Caulobacter sp. TaxID=158749 RepID=UPI0026368951|nr:lasso peptide biosynthesis B2 protein [uncultured Caulobacter sp.]
MRLRPDVHLARLGRDVVLLDAGLGEYLCLPDAAELFFQPATGPVEVLDDAVAREAAALGLAGAGRSVAAPLPPSPRADLIDHPASSIRGADWMAGAGAWTTMLVRYHGRSFGRLIAHAAQTRRHVEAPAPARLADEVAIFRHLLPWAPCQGVCLYRSFFLLTFLRRRGLDATWVFGVQTWPFEAHCWLQAGETVLDDRLDHVLPFTPILAV